MLTIRTITDGQVRVIDRDELAAARAESGYVWIDLVNPDDDEVGVLKTPEVALDRLTLDDMVNARHLPKVDLHGDELALTVHGLALDTIGVELTTLELDVAVKDGLLVTYQEEPLTAIQAVARRLDHRGARRLDRPLKLLHLVLDTMTDVLVPFVDHLDTRLDVIEDDILSAPTEATRHDIYALQRDVIQLRRAIVPQAEVIRRLAREPIELVTDEDRELFRDIYHHLSRVTELCDSYQQLLTSAMESYRSALNDNVNRILTVLTMISALLLPISVLAAIYGMNFEYMPELSLWWAYPALWGIFLLLVAGMLTWFHRRGWIGRAAEHAAHQRRATLSKVLRVPVLGRVLEVPVASAGVVARAGRRLRGRSHTERAGR